MTDGNAILVQAIYIAVAVGLTVWLARTLFRNGDGVPARRVRRPSAAG